MADTKSTQRAKIPGIRRWKRGWQAHVEIQGRTYSKSFPLMTANRIMQAWRSEQIHKFSEQKEDAALRELAAAYGAKRLPRSLNGWCYVYFAQCGAVVKIGRAVDPAERIRALQTAHAERIALIASVAAHVTLEAAIHKRFKHLRTREDSEWFRLEQDLVAFISLIQQGANPVALLFEDPRVVLGWYLRPPKLALKDGA